MRKTKWSDVLKLILIYFYFITYLFNRMYLSRVLCRLTLGGVQGIQTIGADIINGFFVDPKIFLIVIIESNPKLT